MKVAIDKEGRVGSTHLPPVEHSSLLTINRKGRVVATDMIDTPVNEWGVPQPREYLSTLAQTLYQGYEPPSVCNVHHLAHPRRDYHADGQDSIPYRYRESPSLMVDMTKQIHNYGHWVMLPPKMPPYEIMEQVVLEQDQINRLYKIGHAIVTMPRWLDDMFGEGQVLYRTAVQYAADRAVTPDMFYDMLDECQDGQLGLMPPREQLAAMGVAAATRHLGVLASARALSMRRHSREVVRRDGIEEPIAA